MTDHDIYHIKSISDDELYINHWQSKVKHKTTILCYRHAGYNLFMLHVLFVLIYQLWKCFSYYTHLINWLSIIDIKKLLILRLDSYTCTMSNMLYIYMYIISCKYYICKVTISDSLGHGDGQVEIDLGMHVCIYRKSKKWDTKEIISAAMYMRGRMREERGSGREKEKVVTTYCCNNYLIV